MRILIGILGIIALAGCKPKQETSLKTGTWRAELEIQGQALPFNFDLQQNSDGQYVAFIKNAGERLLLDEIRIEQDTVEMVLHIFDAKFRASIQGDSLKGYFTIHYATNYRLPFRAAAGQAYRFIPTDTTASVMDYSGKYDVEFFNPNSVTTAVGIFNQKGNYAEGTFLTPTGDYRYLEGNIINDTLWLSTFDGNHIYLFNAIKSGDTLQGIQWLGRSRERKWTGVRNDLAQLPASESLTYLKEGYDRLEFSFPDINGNLVSPQDERFRNKVLVIQIMGTWCPNCMDETRFLKEWYLKNKDRGVEILGLAYEQKDDFDYASSRVRKMKEKLGVEYELLIAGVNDNAKASETLPALNRVMAFPTTIFVGKDGKVKHIHTGFSGPGTGIYYEEMKERFNRTIHELLAEGLH